MVELKHKGAELQDVAELRKIIHELSAQVKQKDFAAEMHADPWATLSKAGLPEGIIVDLLAQEAVAKGRSVPDHIALTGCWCTVRCCWCTERCCWVTDSSASN